MIMIDAGYRQIFIGNCNWNECITSTVEKWLGIREGREHQTCHGRFHFASLQAFVLLGPMVIQILLVVEMSNKNRV
jgi:hypothetical protein